MYRRHVTIFKFEIEEHGRKSVKHLQNGALTTSGVCVIPWSIIPWNIKANIVCLFTSENKLYYFQQIPLYFTGKSYFTDTDMTYITWGARFDVGTSWDVFCSVFRFLWCAFEVHTSLFRYLKKKKTIPTNLATFVYQFNFVFEFTVTTTGMFDRFVFLNDESAHLFNLDICI